MTAERPPIGGGRTVRAALVDALLVAAAVAALSASFAAAPGWLGVAGAALAVVTVAIAVVDRRRLIIPDQLNMLAFLIGLGAAALMRHAAPGAAVLNALLRASVMFAAFFAFRAGYRQLRGREGMGLGDVKLAAVAGAWLNWTDLPIAIDIAALSALAWVLLGGAKGKERSLTEKLPFGLFFAPAIWICWLLAVWRDS